MDVGEHHLCGHGAEGGTDGRDQEGFSRPRRTAGAEVAAVQRQSGRSREEAEQWVEQVDRERRGFVREHFHKDPADPEQYDLQLNVSRLAPTQCADLIVTALRQLQGAAVADVAAGTRHAQ